MTCIIVVGCYRTGSSAVAGMLHKLGVVMGDKFDPPNANNPKGFWEDVELKNLHKQMLEGENPDTEYKYHIQRRKQKYKFWGVKDPRLCMLLPVLTSKLDEAGVDHKVIECIRSPLDIAESLSKSSDSKIDWHPYVQAHIARKQESLLEYKGPKLCLTFTEIFNGHSLDHIAQFVGREITTEAREWMIPKN